MAKYRWAIAAVVLLACGSAVEEGPSNQGAGGSDNRTKLDASSFCAAWSKVAIDFFERCLPGTIDWALFLGINDTCPLLPASIAAGRVHYDADVGAECLKRVPNQSCEDVFESQVRVLCAALTGQLPEGAACNPNIAECAGGALCRPLPSGTCGAVCTHLIKEGGQCDTAKPCELTLSCTNGICTQLPQENAACLGPIAGTCDSRNYCEGGGGTQPGKCVARKDEPGAPCADPYECISQRCVNGVCVDRTPVGADCVVGANECIRPASCIGGKCTGRLAETGEPCNIFSNVNAEVVNCADGLYCDRNARLCQPLKSPGQACVGAGECAGDNPTCQGRICTACSSP